MRYSRGSLAIVKRQLKRLSKKERLSGTDTQNTLLPTINYLRARDRRNRAIERGLRIGFYLFLYILYTAFDRK